MSTSMQYANALEFQRVKHFLHHFAENGGSSVFLTGGGEPGLYHQLPDLFLFFSNSPLSLSLNTNGCFIDALVTQARKDPRVLEEIWSHEKHAILSISFHNRSSLEGVKKLRSLVDQLNLSIDIRVSFLIDENMTSQQVEKTIKKIAESGADIAAPKPMHIHTSAIGFKGQTGERMFVTNEEVRAFLNSLNPSDFPIAVCPMRINRLAREFRPQDNPNYNLILCLASFARIVVNAYGELSICCNTKMPIEGTGGKYFPCGEGLVSSVSDYYKKVLLGMITFDSFYCVHGCGYFELNNNWDTQYQPILGYMKSLRKNYHIGVLSRSEVASGLEMYFAPAENI